LGHSTLKDYNTFKYEKQYFIKIFVLFTIFLYLKFLSFS